LAEEIIAWLTENYNISENQIERRSVLIMQNIDEATAEWIKGYGENKPIIDAMKHAKHNSGKA